MFPLIKLRLFGFINFIQISTNLETNLVLDFNFLIYNVFYNIVNIWYNLTRVYNHFKFYVPYYNFGPTHKYDFNILLLMLNNITFYPIDSTFLVECNKKQYLHLIFRQPPHPLQFCELILTLRQDSSLRS